MVVAERLDDASAGTTEFFGGAESPNPEEMSAERTDGCLKNPMTSGKAQRAGIDRNSLFQRRERAPDKSTVKRVFVHSS
jgi:hypothetical protein